MTVKSDQSKDTRVPGLEGNTAAPDLTAAKKAALSGLWLMFKLFVLVAMLLAAIPFCWLVEALIWHYMLAQVAGITFPGGFWAAFTFSAALGGFMACANLLAAVIVDSYKKLHKIAVEKTDPESTIKLRTWTDLCAKVPGSVAVERQFAFKTLGLFLLSCLQPLALHFDGAYPLLLAAALLTATWVTFMFLLNLSTALMLRNVKTFPGQSLPPSSRQI
ncbi:MAG: hypothetical protein KGS72_12730 [Cyanobacteria bacterium REEB67]|nr:hypothetical protein [Cyanobacteria bacterium REEB67]